MMMQSVSMLARCGTLLRREHGFASADAEIAHRAIAAALNKHRVSWGRGTVDTALHAKSVGSLKILFLRYGPLVTIERQQGDFYIVQAPIRGRAMWRGRGASLTLDRNVGAVLSPTTRGVIEWSERCEQILVKIPALLVERVWRSLSDAPLRAPPEFQPALVLSGSAGSWFAHLVDFALHDPQLDDRLPAGATLARRLEELFVLKLLMAQPHSQSAEMHRGGIAPKSVRLAEDYMRAHLRERITLFDLAEQANVSVRSLLRAFRSFRQASPISALRAMRLDAARDELLAGPPGLQIADIALRWGFGNLGRFAEQYRRRFGEVPSATRRR
jgi:AraC-like DNA-binding protein